MFLDFYLSNFILMFTFCSQFLQPLIKEFSATAVNWDTAHTAVSFVFRLLFQSGKSPECSLVHMLQKREQINIPDLFS